MSGLKHLGGGYLALFTALYALQGVVVAYFFNFNQIYMISAGVDERAAAGVQSLALLPFVLKFLAGPVSDRVNFFGFGHRKPYVILGLVVQSIGLLGLSWLNPANATNAFTIVAIFTVAGLALYDTCCDGMVIDVTPPDDRARVQGTLVAARAVAAMLCSIAFGFWLDGAEKGEPQRFREVLWGCTALGVIPFVQALRLAEPSRASDAERFQWKALKVLILPRSLVLLAFGAVYSFVGYGVEINLSPYYKDLGFKESGVGAFGSARYVGRAIGAGLLTLMSSRVARRWILATAVIGLAISTAGQAMVSGWASAAGWGLAFGAANGWADALFFVLAMEASDPRMAASTYALFMAVTNVSVLGGWLFSELKTAMGRDSLAFVASGLAVLGALVFVPALGRNVRKPEATDVRD